MNRRGFLHALALAPVAAPVLAKTMHPYAKGGLVTGYSELIVGEVMTFEPMQPLTRHGEFKMSQESLATLDELKAALKHADRRWFGERQSVLEQMRSHDLFDLEIAA